MNIVIIGAGNVGTNIADYLSKEGHDITVIDESKDRLSDVGDLMDVATLTGHAADHAILQQAGVADADLFLAVTNHDEVNLISAFTAKRMGARTAVARVRSRVYHQRVDLDYTAALKIDLMLSPERLTAQEIVKYVDNPAALAMETYARGRVEMRRFYVERDSPLLHQPLHKIKMPQGTLVVSISRGDDVIIPTGQDTIEPDDRVALIGLPRQINEAQGLFSTANQEIGARQEAVLAGGGETGFYLAETLERRGHRVKLIESDRERCQFLSEHLESATVVHGDARNMPFLKEERVGGADVFIATTGDDETNVMSSLLARELGVRKTCCLVDRPDYVNVIRKTGVDLVLSPRVVTASKVLALVKRGQIRSVSILEEGKAEIVEFIVGPNASIINQPLKDIRLPPGCLVATIVHKGQVLIPRGSSMMHRDDIVIIAGLSGSIDRVEAMFAGDGA